ncbi:Arylesterase [Paraburkholderia hiiakae]|uniref:Arylesterase n=1 Tax=Paraburkholderia hiiakae TaxID=1081782 RepID=A0ABN7HPE5_9BURK|nr:alpha/beta hydrolase [Paraburkholderia hiiakae]CAD6529997.1 Arylesterase [Paraburkholderia hiiakae]
MARDTLNARQPGFIRIDDDTALHYRDWGDGVPLVFLSGWTLNADMWNYQCAPLAASGFRCVAYDRRGHGRSSDPGRGYDYDTLADDLEAVLDARDLARVTLVGHSFASGEIVRYLSRHGARRVAGIVLVSPASTPCLLKTADNPGGLDSSLFEASIDEMLTSFPDWIERRAEAYFSPGTSRGVIQWTADMMLGASLYAAAQLSHEQMVTDFRRELAAIDVPALVLHGDCDASAPLEITGGPTAAALERATLKVYEGGTHGMYFNHAARVNEDIRAFVTRWQA